MNKLKEKENLLMFNQIIQMHQKVVFGIIKKKRFSSSFQKLEFLIGRLIRL